MSKNKFCIWTAVLAILIFSSNLSAQPLLKVGKNIPKALRAGETLASEISHQSAKSLQVLRDSWRCPALNPSLGEFACPEFSERCSAGVLRAESPEIFCPYALQLDEILAAKQRARGIFPGKERIDAVIFDMDGTLLDSLGVWDHVAAKYLQTRGIELSEEIQEYITHISLLEGARYIKNQLNLPDTPEELLEGALSLVRSHYFTDIEAKPGAPEVLRQLKAQGIKIGVATASDKELALIAFRRLGLLPYIDIIVSCDEVGVGKLSPAVYEETLSQLGASKSRTLVVEDALYALQTAKTAGFPTAGIADPYHTDLHEREVDQTADYFFTSFKSSLK